MSPPPLEPHNHSQTHIMLSRWLPLQAQFSAILHTAKLSKLSGAWTFLSLEISKNTESQGKAQTPSPFLISGLNRWPCWCLCA
ncbi:hypothetical protein HKD37_17G048587 [Glycine soja]